METLYRSYSLGVFLAAAIILCLTADAVAMASDRESRRNIQRLSRIGNLHSTESEHIIESRFFRNHHSGSRTYLTKSVNTETVAYVVQQWVNQAWQNAERALDVVDNMDRVIEEIIQRYQNNDWQNYERFLLDYDGTSDLVVTEIFQIWEDGDWENYWRDLFEYDTEGRLIELIWEDWRNDEWVPTDRFVSSYDNDGRLEEVITYWWYLGDWELEYRETYSYENGNLVEILEEFWDGVEWEVEERILFEYDNDGNKILQISQHYDDFDEVWVNDRQTINEYDQQGNKIESIDQIWEDEEWQNDQRREAEYDAVGNIISEITSNWVGVDWFYSHRGNYEYDDEGNLHVLLMQSWTGSEWQNSFRIIFGEPLTHVTDDRELPHAFSLYQNYPNPFNPTTTIRFTIPEQADVSLVIYDILGKKVKTLIGEKLQPGEYSHIFDASQLPSGVYLYRVRAGNHVQTKRLVLVR